VGPLGIEQDILTLLISTAKIALNSFKRAF
jgi:hypothetical protein